MELQKFKNKKYLIATCLMFVESVIEIIIQHVDHVNCNVNRIYLPNVYED